MPIVLRLKLESFVKGKEKWDMNEDEKLQFGIDRKNVGAALFKQKRVQLAMQRYKAVSDLFEFIDSWKDESKKEKAKEARRMCELNKALCALKLLDHSTAKECCDKVIKEEPRNVKALYRRASAQLGLKEYLDAMKDLSVLLEVEPGNSEAKRLLQEARASQKKADRAQKDMFAKMVSGLGRGKEDPRTGFQEKQEYAEDDDISDGDEAAPDEKTQGKSGESRSENEKENCSGNGSTPGPESEDANGQAKRKGDGFFSEDQPEKKKARTE
eukprot:gnl/MRDRNA2_/MRDRNA2_27736_c0_seq2.p1 gnl/MRDRNA2_/MRDRNA2_27736_c0~~gnl/MRDRNA2_/MRDRNA2_27736_c0_seq2.p1  ORF type:complete len:270 (+),score=74.12 gnl/MRDRNA2_/MRDRNA2_27736_c0_seq2:114-923(+)